MEIRDYILNLEKRAADAAMEMGCASFEKRNEVLLRLAAKLRENTDKIIDVNKIDLDNAGEFGMTVKDELDGVTDLILDFEDDLNYCLKSL